MKKNIFNTRVEKVIPEKINLDWECQYDLITGNGIRITSVESFRKKTKNEKGEEEDPNISKKNEKIYNGLQSPFFGTDFPTDAAYNERFSCKCKKYIGSAYLGHICENCGTAVDFVETDLKKFGWIIIEKYKVLSPIFAIKLQDILGKVEKEPILSAILNVKYEKDEDGNNRLTPREEKMKAKCPFIKKGMVWLYEHFDEVLDYYYNLKKKSKSESDISKCKIIDEMRRDRDAVFTSCIPVFSSVLRVELPGEKDKKAFKMKSNTIYRSMIKLSRDINRTVLNNEDLDKLETEIKIDRLLFGIHKEVIELFGECFNMIDGKKGIVQSKVVGGRYNFSARNVIVPNIILRANECEASYITFLELYRYELVNMYSKINNCSPRDADRVWSKARVDFNPQMYKLMKYMVNESGDYLNILVSRNPMINFGSGLTLKIVGVKSDIDDKTLSVPTPILKTMNADFDGDMFNVFRLIGADFGKRFMKNLDPRYNLYINRINGRVNKDTMPMKDELTGFWMFNNL